MKYLMILTLTLVVGCAGVQLTPEEEQHIAVICKDDAVCIVNTADKALGDKIQRLEDEAEDRRLIARDKLIINLNACDAAEHLVVMEIVRGGRSQLPTKLQMQRAFRERGVRYTHENVGRHARWPHNIKCVDPQDIIRQIRGGL